MNSLITIACATCVNQDGGTDVVAANGAVFVMIGALGVIFLGIIGILFAFMRRARRFASTQSN
jgi:hypothetical protein